MARKNTKGTDVSDTPVEVPAAVETDATELPQVENSTDTVAVDLTGETPAEVTEAPVADATAKKEKVDRTAELDTFKNTVTEAAKGADTSTGAIADETIAQVTESYQALTGDRKAQNTAKEYVGEQITKAVDDSNDEDKMLSAIVSARSWLQIQRAIDSVASATKAAPKEPVDPTEAFVRQYATLDLALVVAFNNPPEGVAEDWNAQSEELVNSVSGDMESYSAWLAQDPESRGDAPEVNALVLDAFKLAEGKAVATRKGKGGGTRTPFAGERGDIGEHIAQAFAKHPVGTELTVAQIVAFESTGAGYNGRKPSQGAVSARLRSNSWDVKTTGVEPMADTTPFKARKVAEATLAQAQDA